MLDFFLFSLSLCAVCACIGLLVCTIKLVQLCVVELKDDAHKAFYYLVGILGEIFRSTNK